MDFNKEVSYQFFLAKVDPYDESVYPIGLNCADETLEKLRLFFESDYKEILALEAKKDFDSIYRTEVIGNVGIWEFIVIKWNKLWRRKQITTSQ